jgi:hypothetical protein
MEEKGFRDAVCIPFSSQIVVVVTTTIAATE